MIFISMNVMNDDNTCIMCAFFLLIYSKQHLVLNTFQIKMLHDTNWM